MEFVTFYERNEMWNSAGNPASGGGDVASFGGRLGLTFDMVGPPEKKLNRIHGRALINCLIWLDLFIREIISLKKYGFFLNILIFRRNFKLQTVLCNYQETTNSHYYSKCELDRRHSSRIQFN